MTLFVPSISEDDLFTALRDFLILVAPTVNAADIVQGQVNRVAAPDAALYIVFTPGPRKRLATNTVEWDQADPAPAVETHTAPTQVSVQLDVYGDASADVAQTISTVFRSEYAPPLFPVGIAPLYCDDPQQMPFLDGENQYENRWTFYLHLQVNAAISTPADFADTLAVTTQPPADSGASQ